MGVKDLVKRVLLEEDDIVVVPSETVYGLAGNALSKKAVHRIFQVKSRPVDNPLICHIASEDQVFPLVEFTGDSQKDLFALLHKAFWPGPLTMVFHKNPNISNYAAQNFPTVAFRIPSHPIFFDLLKTVQVPLAAPSANISGRPSGTRFEDILLELSDKVPVILKDGPPPLWGIESTVLDLTIPGQVNILRPGGVSLKDLQRVLPKEISIGYGSRVEGIKEKSPGLKYAHYQPRFSVFLWEEEPPTHNVQNHSAFIVRMPELRETLQQQGSVWVYVQAESLAKDLYHLLYHLEKQGIQRLFIQTYPEEGLGHALMDRLRRIASH